MKVPSSGSPLVGQDSNRPNLKDGEFDIYGKRLFLSLMWFICLINMFKPLALHLLYYC